MLNARRQEKPGVVVTMAHGGSNGAGSGPSAPSGIAVGLSRVATFSAGKRLFMRVTDIFDLLKPLNMYDRSARVRQCTAYDGEAGGAAGPRGQGTYPLMALLSFS